MNGTLNWGLDQHRAFLLVKYVSGVNHNFTGGSTFFAATAALAHGQAFADRFLDSSINSWITADAQYTYSFDDLKYLSHASVSVGVLNLTNEEPLFVPVITGYDSTLHDPRRRVWTLRLSASL